MIKKISEHINFFVKNKFYIISLVVFAIAGYGYQLFHGTCGIDDVVIDMYFEDGLGVAIGRWPFFYINKIIPVASEYIPFFTDFLAVLLLMFGAILWCSVIREIVKEELPILCYSVFSAMFLLYSLIAEVFIFYLHNGIAIIYCIVGFALFAFYYIWAYKITIKEKITVSILLAVILCVGISFYESAANLYLFGVLLVLFMDALRANQLCARNIKSAFVLLGHTACVLVLAIVGRTMITRFTMSAFSLQDYFFRSVTDISWMSAGGFRELYVELVMLIKLAIKEYFAVGVVYYPILLFALTTILYVIFVIYMSIRKKSVWVFLYGVGTYASLYILTIIQCDTLKYRSCQMFSVFVGIVLMMFTKVILKKSKWIKRLGLALVCGIIVYSAIDLNGWFIYDYEKNQLELQVVHEIGEELQSGKYDIEHKPVVFVGEFLLDEEVLDKCYVDKGEWGYPVVKWVSEWMELESDSYCITQIMDLSLINWGIESLASYSGYNKPLQDLFEYCGYSFIWAQSELYEEVMPIYYDYYGPGYEYMKTEAYGEEEQYPYEGYIEETEDFIVVKL